MWLDLLGHKSTTRITTHYSAAELDNLIDAAIKVCVARNTLTPLRVISGRGHEKLTKSNYLKLVSNL
jgi:hypothetical protein